MSDSHRYQVKNFWFAQACVSSCGLDPIYASGIIYNQHRPVTSISWYFSLWRKLHGRQCSHRDAGTDHSHRIVFCSCQRIRVIAFPITDQLPIRFPDS